MTPDYDDDELHEYDERTPCPDLPITPSVEPVRVDLDALRFATWPAITSLQATDDELDTDHAETVMSVIAALLFEEVRLLRAKLDDVDLIRTAICDPGQFLPRGDDYTESIGSWGARAVVAALGESS